MNTGNKEDSTSSPKGQEQDDSPPPPPQKHHTLTVCMVPPEEATEVWETVSRARMELRDPGFYRWPPHANLLYPFVSLRSKVDSHNKTDEPAMELDYLRRLRNATRQCEPFQVTLRRLGTFGGKQRGVLWIYPESSRQGEEVVREPLIELQALLGEEFPFCNDQQKQDGEFNPHMTLSHFPDLPQAQTAKEQIESWWTSPRSFTCNEIYVLERNGDNGQFRKLATLRLGEQALDADPVRIHTPTLAFSTMPTKEEDWVHEERMKLKERRNKSWNRRGRRRRGRRKAPVSNREDTRSDPSRSTDTPEEIAAKRAERKAKRERIERQKLVGNDIEVPD